VTEGGRSCRTIISGGAKYLCVNDTLAGPDGEYSLIYIKNISALYRSLRGQTAFLFSVGAAITVVFAFGLYFTLKSVYRPVGNLAHELRTPLTSIRGYAEYLQAAAATEEERYSASQYIIDESKRLSDVCDKLLILANLREGDIPFEKVDIKALFENAKMTFGHVEYEAETQYIRGNRTLLQSMINNLVSNALKACAPGDTVTLRCRGNMIEVTDHGCGISGELLSKVSKPGYSPGISVKNNSSGLGIPLCHNIARLHNAQLTFTSAVNEGTTATITFTIP
jgi:two-component system OmpR family sensor kinase